MQSKKRDAALFGGALLLLVLLMLLSLRFGSTYLSARQFFGGLCRMPKYRSITVILYAVRLPRMLGGVLAGAGLALAGTLLQKVTDNPLAAPNILGINSGAGFGVMLYLCVMPHQPALLPLAAFLGAILAALGILTVSGRAGMDKVAVVLCGVAFSALFGAGISFLSVLDADVLASYADFSVGSLQGVTLQDLYFPAPIIALCFAVALALSRKLQLFCLGDSLANSLGISVKRVRLLTLILAAASSAAAVSFAGLLGFVGLLVPHICRKLVKNDTRREILLSPIAGGILLLSADLLGRLIFAPTEVPVGIFTALLGVPFFLTLLIRRRRHA